MSILDSVLKKVTGRQRQAAENYGDFVRQVADEKEPDVDRLAEVLHATGKTTDDLRSDVQALQQRRRLREDYDAAKPAKTRLAEIQQALEKIEVRREANEKKLDDERWPMESEAESLNTVLTKADAARQQLYNTSTDTGILQRTTEIFARRDVIVSEITTCRSEMINVEEACKEVRRRRSHSQDDADIATYTDQQRDKAKKISDFEAELTSLTKEIAALDAKRLKI